MKKQPLGAFRGGAGLPVRVRWGLGVPRGIAQVPDSRRDAGAAGSVPPVPLTSLLSPWWCLFGDTAAAGDISKSTKRPSSSPKTQPPAHGANALTALPSPTNLIPSYSRQEGPAPRPPGYSPAFEPQRFSFSIAFPAGLQNTGGAVSTRQLVLKGWGSTIASRG